jgi:hypothetical protein
VQGASGSPSFVPAYVANDGKVHCLRNSGNGCFFTDLETALDLSISPPVGEPAVYMGVRNCAAPEGAPNPCDRFVQVGHHGCCWVQVDCACYCITSIQHLPGLAHEQHTGA